MTVRDLLGGLLLPSGNDAAYALARGVGGSVPRFVDLMNERSRALGLTPASATRSASTRAGTTPAPRTS